jgi:hypothetical protein
LISGFEATVPTSAERGGCPFLERLVSGFEATLAEKGGDPFLERLISGFEATVSTTSVKGGD